MGAPDTRWHLRIGVGHLEVDADPAPPVASWPGRLRTSMAACWPLVVGIVCAQLTDVATTAIALAQPGYYEQNVLMRQVTAAGVAAILGVKLGAVLAVILLALWRLPRRRARVALALALGLTLVGPVANLVTLAH